MPTGSAINSSKFSRIKYTLDPTIPPTAAAKLCPQQEMAYALGSLDPYLINNNRNKTQALT